MANFWDLPRPVRDTIYRLHLVQDNHLDEDIHTTLTQKDPRTTEKYSWKFVPPICIVSQKAEAEAAPIYYGENHFAFGRTKDGDGSSIFMFTLRTWPRHIRLIRKVTYQWPKPHTFYGSESGMAGEAFTEISRFKGLQELYIRVDEKAMIRRTLVSRRSVQRSPPRSLHYQDGFALLRHPGMSGLLKISDVPRVQFVKRFNKKGEKEGGPIPGGFLMTEILPKLKAHRTKKAPRRR